MSRRWSTTPTDLTTLVADGRLRPDEAEMLRTVARVFRLRRAAISLLVLVASITAAPSPPSASHRV